VSSTAPDDHGANTTGGPNTTGLAHWLGFLASGVTAFIVDGAVLKLLTVIFGVPVLPARVVSIAASMVVGFMMHRRFTFRIAAPPTLAELARFIGVAWSTAVVNYSLFVGFLYLWPAVEPLVAVFGAGLIAMVWSYLGLRFAAFRGQRG
jgi:putative flippase GtrA